MFHIHNATIISPCLFFFVLFQYCLNSLTFWELALTFVKRISKKAFFPCCHTPRACISGLASSSLLCVCLFFHYLFFVKKIRFQRHFESFSVDKLQNLLRCYVSMSHNNKSTSFTIPGMVQIVFLTAWTFTRHSL